MNFVGKKVVLRAIERGDLKILADFHNDPAVAESIEFSWPISLAHQDRFFERITTDENTRRLVIETQSDGVIGYTGLWGIQWIDRRATAGIVIGRRDLQRKGYGTDALRTLMHVAFNQIGLHRLDALVFEFNAASLKLFVSTCGWKEEGRRREYVYRNGKFWDALLLGITAAEYAEVSRAR